MCQPPLGPARLMNDFVLLRKLEFLDLKSSLGKPVGCLSPFTLILDVFTIMFELVVDTFTLLIVIAHFLVESSGVEPLTTECKSVVFPTIPTPRNS